ncbi:MAG: hypothetical protein JWQ35_827 [Bacteriovoracaceae bacterium]|nr:hypothetical protein [Bacteriovoracaceae bacterium]
MFLMPFRNFGFSLILLVVTFPACRADDDIQLVLGSTMQQVLDQQPQVRSLLQKAPAIQNVLDTTADTANKIIKENEFLASIDRCGFDKPPTREQFAETIVRDPINIYTESIQSDKNPLIAVNIQTRIFSIDHFKQYLETQDVKTSLLNKSSFKNKNLKLAATLITEATLPNSTAVVLGPIQPIAVETKLPIIIRSNCFQLNQGEEISTDGRDLYIVSDKVVINGTIRTTPQGRDDQPGDAAGSVYIIAVNLEFGIDSKVDVTGGNGGNINLSAGKFIGDAFTPDKQAFFSEVERSLNMSS